MGPGVSGPGKRSTPSNNSKGLNTTGRTPCGNKPERTTPSRSPFGARMQWPEPAHTEQSLARDVSRPTKGGAVRIRIALVTAMAVLVVAVPVVLMSLFTSDPAWAQSTHHQAVSSHRAADVQHPVRINDKLMSYSQARKVAQLVTYANAVQAAKQANSLKALAFVEAVAAQEHTIPAAWVATAICEEGGRNDPYAGYFGILEWNGFDGYRTAGSAPLTVQLAWEARYVGGPPDAPGHCHSY
jgi:hypothetical protein